MKSSGSIPLIFVVAVFILGNSVINLPFTKYGSNAFFGIILALIISLPLFILYDKIKNNLKTDTIYGKVFIIFYSLYCLFSGIICMRNFITFSDKVILPEINSLFPIVLYLILVYILSVSDEKVIIKTAFAGGLVITVIMLLMFILSTKNMSFSGLLPQNEFDLKGIFYECFSYISLSFAPAVCLFGFISKNNQKIYFKGYLLGSVLLIITFLQSIAIMGYELSSQLIHPYASSVSIITLGNSYSRLEGFSYLIYFTASLSKTALCVLVAKKSFCLTFPKTKRIFLPIVLVIFGAVSLFVSYFKNIDIMKVSPYILLPLFIILPTFWIKSKRIKEQ